MNPAIDCAMAVPKLTAGKVNRAVSQALRFGGKGINVSYVLKEFGGKSVLTGFTAGFTGDALSDGLTKEGFDCDFVRLNDGNTRINVKLTGNTATGDPDTELNVLGPSPSEEELQKLTDKLTKLNPGDAVILAGSMPHGVSADYIKTVADALPVGVAFICDLSGDALRTALTCSPDFVKPNVHELYELMGVDSTPENLCDRKLMENCAVKLIKAGAKNALITMGEDGGFYITANGESGFVPSPIFHGSANLPRSAVGCGDSAVAGWLIGMGFAGDNVRSSTLTAAGISPSESPARSAAELAILLGSASYFCGFPASPEKVSLL